MEGGKVVSALYTHGREGCIYMIVEAYRNSAGSHFFCLEKGRESRRGVPWELGRGGETASLTKDSNITVVISNSFRCIAFQVLSKFLHSNPSTKIAFKGVTN